MRRETRPVQPAMATGAILCAAALIAGLWLGDWRWVPTGLILLFLGAIVANSRKEH